MNASRVAALRAMAGADESPNERDIARAKLAEAGIPVEPPRPPAPAAAAAPEPFHGFTVWYGNNATVVTGVVWWHFETNGTAGR